MYARLNAILGERIKKKTKIEKDNVKDFNLSLSGVCRPYS